MGELLYRSAERIVAEVEEPLQQTIEEIVREVASSY